MFVHAYMCAIVHARIDVTLLQDGNKSTLAHS